LRELRELRSKKKKMVAVKTVAILLRLITKDPKRNEPKWAKRL
jgi:hypothetical protein